MRCRSQKWMSLGVPLLLCVCTAPPVTGQQARGVGSLIPTPAPDVIPSSGFLATQKFTPETVSTFLGGRIARTLGSLQPDRLTARGATEARLYARLSPSVVLVVTDEGFGSGSVVGPAGLVLTNWHVVAGYEYVAVIFKPAQGGAEPTRADVRRGQVIRVDEIADLALLRVVDPPLGRDPIPLGTLTSLSVGDDVHAIGHPTGEAWTYTKGIVSQIRRGYEWSVDDVLHRADVVQTQTPINPGNSGGPLFSSQGVLVGVNSFIAEGEGLNFAVAVSDVQRLLAAKEDRIAQRQTGEGEGTGCELKILGETRLEEEKATATVADTDCDGRADSMLVIPDQAASAIELRLDSNGDGRIDIVVLDANRDGRWDESFADTDGDGVLDLRGVHGDGTLTPTRVEQLKK